MVKNGGGLEQGDNMNQNALTLELLRRHNKGKIQLSENDKELLAMKAKRLGQDFKVESKPLSKGAFDFADMAAFSLLPNKWRPHSAGQDLYGETGYDRFAGGVGSLAGFGTGIYGGVKASKFGWNAIKKAFAKKKADDIATNLYKGNLLGPARPLPPGPRTPQLPGGGRYPMQTTPQVGSVGRSMASRRQQLEDAIANMKANPLPRYQEGGEVKPGMLDFAWKKYIEGSQEYREGQQDLYMQDKEYWDDYKAHRGYLDTVKNDAEARYIPNHSKYQEGGKVYSGTNVGGQYKHPLGISPEEEEKFAVEQARIQSEVGWDNDVYNSTIRADYPTGGIGRFSSSNQWGTGDARRRQHVSMPTMASGKLDESGNEIYLPVQQPVTVKGTRR